MASVRAIVPGQIKTDDLFQPLTAALERYPADSYELIIGAAQQIDAPAKTVLVAAAAGGGSSERTLAYDQLVIATGSHCTSTTTVPWKHLDSHAATAAALDATRARVAAAASIIVAGAGATGIELAGELGCELGAAATKEVTLLAGGPALMDGDSVGPAARAELLKLGVKVRTHARVASAQELPDGRTAVSLVSGETLTADLYLPTMGMQANAEMLDAKYLTEHGYVAVDEFYRVKGLEGEGVWAAGDVVSKPRGGYMITQKQVKSSPPPSQPSISPKKGSRELLD